MRRNQIIALALMFPLLIQKQKPLHLLPLFNCEVKPAMQTSSVLHQFWQPPLKEGEDVDPDNAEFLPLGFDEFYGREVIVQEGNMLMSLRKSVANARKPMFDRLEKWTKEKKKASEAKMELIKKELELVEAELSLKKLLKIWMMN